jgi:sodium transport system permease protein
MNQALSTPPRPSRWELLPRAARVGRLARKELAEILCDRRTILTLLLMPLLLYTLLSFAFRQFLMVFMTSTGPVKELRVAVESEERKRLVEAYLAYGAQVPPWQIAGIVGLEASTPPLPGTLLAATNSLIGRFRHEPYILLANYETGPLRRARPALVFEVMKNPRKALALGQVDAALLVSEDLFLSRIPLESPPGLEESAASTAGHLGSPLGVGPFLAATDAFARPTTPTVPVLGASTVGLICSPQGPGPLLAVTALYPGRAVRRHPLRVLMDADFPIILDWDLRYLQFSARSREAVAILEQHCALANARQLHALLSGRGLGKAAVPVRIVRVGVETSEPTPGLSLSALVPLILILMTITGAVYPAIDLTAGERERGTLEILVAAPVPRLALLFAKYLAVVAVAMLTASVNLALMLVTLYMNGLTREVFRQTGITVQLVAELFFLLVLFAAFFSAVLLAMTSFARSFKEAQAYLIPLMLASLVPGVLGMMPGLRLSGILAVTPLVNIVLLARDLAEKTASVGTAVVVVGSTLVYAAAAITVAARIFGAEGVLFSEQSSWSDLFRRPVLVRPVATVSGALLCLALLIPACFLADAAVAMVPPSARFATLASATMLLFAGIPLLACFMARIRVVTAFQLKPPPWAAWPAALLLAVAALPCVFAILRWMEEQKLMFVTSQMEQLVRALVPWGRPASPAPLVAAATFALIGVAEEVFFRGFLFSALRARAGAGVTIAVTSLLFGLFHFMSLIDKLVPSTLMGLLLGWVCWQTRSVLPGMLLHASYNALLMSRGYYEAVLGGTEEFDEFLRWWLLAAVPAGVIGAGLIWRCNSEGQSEGASKAAGESLRQREFPSL